jgi:hypothetical protein
MGWTWTPDLRAGTQGRALRSPRGAVFELNATRPMFARRFEELRFKDAA